MLKYQKRQKRQQIMEYQKIIKVFDKTTNQLSKLRTKQKIGLKCQYKFKTSVLKSSLYDYSDTHKLLKGTITIYGQGEDAEVIAADRHIKQVTFKNYALFIDCIRERIITQVDNTKDL